MFWYKNPKILKETYALFAVEKCSELPFHYLSLQNFLGEHAPGPPPPPPQGSSPYERTSGKRPPLLWKPLQSRPNYAALVHFRKFLGRENNLKEKEEECPSSTTTKRNDARAKANVWHSCLICVIPLATGQPSRGQTWSESRLPHSWSETRKRWAWWWPRDGSSFARSPTAKKTRQFCNFKYKFSLCYNLGKKPDHRAWGWVYMLVSVDADKIYHCTSRSTCLPF